MSFFDVSDVLGQQAKSNNQNYFKNNPGAKKVFAESGLLNEINKNLGGKSKRKTRKKKYKSKKKQSKRKI